MRNNVDFNMSNVRLMDSLILFYIKNFLDPSDIFAASLTTVSVFSSCLHV